MKNKLLLMALMAIHQLLAQGPGDSAFDRYYSKGLEKVKQLYRSRGLEHAPCAVISYEGEAETKVQNTRSWVEEEVMEHFDGGLGILFYEVADAHLTIWLVRRREGTGSYHWVQTRTPVTEAQLVNAEYALRQSLGVEALSVGRAAVPTQKNRSVIQSKKALPKSNLDAAIKEATQLLLPPAIAAHLSGLQHVYIVPEFNIGQFPFHVLKPFGNGGYLVDSLSHSFVPHLCKFSDFWMLSTARQRRLGVPQALRSSHPVIIGNPAYSKDGGYVLPDLPGAGEEAQAVAAALQAQAVTGKDASIDYFVRQAGEADLLYLATHGYFDFDRLLDGSFLAFAPDSAHPDGLLTARSIQEMKLPAEIAVLSACQTGFGKVYAGGAIGLGRAFNIAGVPFTIVSLWSVDDKATQELMTGFIRFLRRPEKFYPAQPLRQAVLQLKKQYSHPVYWAPFSVFGFTY
ncbi:MAG: CHAT domain-containing protein [Chitinophagaceae bacterium]|jgi:CHAT domain-containing protein|nr:CHAT domain-containing protein [Chitinophagaceae bacterium]